MNALKWAGSVALVSLLAACATPVPYDYTAFRQARPASLLVMPPLNDTPDIHASQGVMAMATQPLAEAGYYVLPVSLVSETFVQNGLSTPADAQAVPLAKLREIFGADAALYLRATKYGTTYQLTNSDTRVTVQARLVDLRSGQLLWEGAATASSLEQNGGGQGGLLGALVRAVVQQVINASSEASLPYAELANQRLLSPRPNGMLYGPRSPHYQASQKN